MERAYRIFAILSLLGCIAFATVQHGNTWTVIATGLLGASAVQFTVSAAKAGIAEASQKVKVSR